MESDDKVFELLANSNKLDLFKDNYFIDDSDIHGKGAFAARDLKEGEIIGTLLRFYEDKMMRTELGSKVNHQFKNNSVMRKHGPDYNLYSTINVDEGSELTVDYKDTPDFIDKDTSGFKELE